MDNFIVKDIEGKEVVEVYQEDGILIIKISKSYKQIFVIKTKSAASAAISAALAYCRMGHLGYYNLAQLAKVTKGIKLIEEPPPSYKYCLKAKLKK